MMFVIVEGTGDNEFVAFVAFGDVVGLREHVPVALLGGGEFSRALAEGAGVVERGEDCRADEG